MFLNSSLGLMANFLSRFFGLYLIGLLECERCDYSILIKEGCIFYSRDYLSNFICIYLAISTRRSFCVSHCLCRYFILLFFFCVFVVASIWYCQVFSFFIFYYVISLGRVRARYVYCGARTKGARNHDSRRQVRNPSRGQSPSAYYGKGTSCVMRGYPRGVLVSVPGYNTTWACYH